MGLRALIVLFRLADACYSRKSYDGCMAWRTESVLLYLIKRREQELASVSHTAEDEWLRVKVELMDLQNELEFVRDNPSASGNADAVVYSPLKPRPHLNSGAIALPEPEEPDEPRV